MQSYFPVYFCGEQFFCDYTGALFWPRQKALIVSDLHLEKGSAYAMRGLMLPPYDTKVTLERLINAIARFEPTTVISLGDSFHDQNAYRRLSSEHNDILQALSRHCRLIWIAGNHDREPTGCSGQNYLTYELGKISFCHEPSAGDVDGEICGHLHPAAKLKKHGITVRRFCFAFDHHRFILPAFGAYAGGLEIRHKAFNGLFNQDDLVLCLLGDKQVYPVQRKYIAA